MKEIKLHDDDYESGEVEIEIDVGFDDGSVTSKNLQEIDEPEETYSGRDLNKSSRGSGRPNSLRRMRAKLAREKAEKDAALEEARTLRDKVQAIAQSADKDIRNLSKRSAASELQQVRSDKEIIERALENAIESNDSQGQIKFQRFLSSLDKKEQELDELVLSSESIEHYAPVAKRMAKAESVKAKEAPEAVLNWIVDNPWADAESEEYDPQLRAMADSVYDEAVDEFEKNGRTSEINTEEFMNYVDKKIKSKNKGASRVSERNGIGKSPYEGAEDDYETDSIESSGRRNLKLSQLLKGLDEYDRTQILSFPRSHPDGRPYSEVENALAWIKGLRHTVKRLKEERKPIPDEYKRFL